MFDEEISASKPLLEHGTSMLGVWVNHVIIHKNITLCYQKQNRKHWGPVLGKPLVVSSKLQACRWMAADLVRIPVKPSILLPSANHRLGLAHKPLTAGRVLVSLKEAMNIWILSLEQLERQRNVSFCIFRFTVAPAPILKHKSSPDGSNGLQKPSVWALVFLWYLWEIRLVVPKWT